MNLPIPAPVDRGRRRRGSANAHRLTDRLAVGDMFVDELATEQLADLVAAGITHVVDLRAPRRGMPEWPAHAGFVVRSAGVVDDGAPRSGEWFDAFVRWVVDVLAGPDTKVLVHCAMGSNRGPSGAFAVLLMGCGISEADVLTMADGRDYRDRRCMYGPG